MRKRCETAAAANGLPSADELAMRGVQIKVERWPFQRCNLAQPDTHEAAE